MHLHPRDALHLSKYNFFLTKKKKWLWDIFLDYLIQNLFPQQDLNIVSVPFWEVLRTWAANVSIYNTSNRQYSLTQFALHLSGFMRASVMAFNHAYWEAWTVFLITFLLPKMILG